MNKIIILIIFSAFFIAMTARAQAADTATLYFSPSSAEADTGCYPKFDIMLDTGGNETTGADIIINFDATKLQVESITEGGLYSNYLTKDYDNEEGKIVIQTTADATETFTTVDGSAETFATIQFKTIAYGEANISFKYIAQGDTTDTNVTDTEGNDILGASVSDAVVDIADGNTCPSLTEDSPTATPTEATGENEEDTINVGGGNASPSAYTAPVSGTAENTIAALLFSALFFAFSFALVRIKN